MQPAYVRRNRRVVSVLSALMLTGLGYLYVAGQAGRSELRALCAQGVHPKVYRQASAPGYFDSGISCLKDGCWDVLLDSRFRFIEVEQRDARPMSILSQNGFYRLTRETTASGRCDATILKDMQTRVYFHKYLERGECVGLEKIDGVTARYGLFSQKLEQIKLHNFFDSKISVRHGVLKDLKSSEIIAERTSYVLMQHSLPSFSSFENAISCADVGERQSVPDVFDVRFYINTD